MYNIFKVSFESRLSYSGSLTTYLQFEHSDEPVIAVAVPDKQLVQVSAPLAENSPVLHAMQTEAPPFEYVPPAHAEQLCEPKPE